MSITVVWDNPEKTVLRFIYEGRWTWDEFHPVINQGNQMTREVEHKVVSIVDMRAASDVPPNALVHLKRVMEQAAKYPNNSGVTIFLDAEAFGKAILSMLKQVYPLLASQMEFLHTDTLEDARAVATRELERLGVRRVSE